MAKVIKKVKLDEISALRERKHADYLWVLDNGVGVIIESTGRPKLKEEFMKIGETRSAIEDGLVPLEHRVTKFVGVVHKKKRIHPAVEASSHYSKKYKMGLKVVSCEEPLKQYIESL